MGEQPAERAPDPLVIPIDELVAENASLLEVDADLLTRLAEFEKIGMDGDTLGRAMDMAFMKPHRTAAMLGRREEFPDQETVSFAEALRLAQEAERSGIAYRLTDNPNLTWMVPLSERARAAVKSDVTYAERRHRYQRELYTPWYRSMQSRLIVCVARLAAGRPLERSRPTRALQQWQALQHFHDETAEIE